MRREVAWPINVSERPFHPYCLQFNRPKTTLPLHFSSLKTSNSALEMKPAFCYKGFTGVKEDHEFPWIRNGSFQLGTEIFGDRSFLNSSSTKPPEFVANSCIQHTFKDKESRKKYQEHNFRYLSTMPPSRPKSRRFSMTYVALIAGAILRFPEKKLTLAQIYQVIEKTFPEFTVTRAGWKNTVRHNLSLHECFVKGEVAANGKSCYWHIHPAYIARFSKGDFRKRPSRELCVLDGHTSLPRVGFDRTQPYTVPFAFGGANSLVEFPSTSKPLHYPTSSSSALTPLVSATPNSSTEWLREYKPYPYYYLFSPLNATLNSHQREKSLRAGNSLYSSNH